MNLDARSSNREAAQRQEPSFLFAPEIETALIALCWREPDRLASVKRELDPALHFIQPHCRWLLEALDLAYRELGDVDFACVAQVLRELGRLEDVGGLEGANEVYNAGDFVNSSSWSTERSERLFAHYLEALKEYAVNRKMDPPRPTYLFTGGKGTLVLNKVKRSKNDPDFVGEARIAGRLYSIGVSLAADGSFMNFRFEPKI